MKTIWVPPINLESFKSKTQIGKRDELREDYERRLNTVQSCVKLPEN